MKKGIILNTFTPLRNSSSYSSEMTSQLLFGELYHIIEYSEDKNWLKIYNLFDGYEGWINQKFHTEIDENTFNQLVKKQSTFCKTGKVYHQNLQIPILWGSPLPFPSPLKFQLNNNFYQFAGEIYSSNSRINLEQLLSEAWKTFQGVPYLWGGKTPFGVDCSGFVQQVLKIYGLQAPRDSSPQSQFFKKETPLKESKTGDLAFFKKKGKITHVGFVLEDIFINRFIGLTNQKSSHWIMHAYKSVSIDVLDEKGVFIDGRYTHQLAFVKRL